MALQFCRSMVLTEKALELFRERRIKNSNTLVADILWLASAEFGRQRSAGFRFRPSDRREGALGLLPIMVWTTEAA